MSQSKRRGRKPKPYIASDGRHINGLRRRRHDGRWILKDGRTFTEPDELKAIDRFISMTDPAPKMTFEDSPAWSIQNGFTFVGGVIAGTSPEERLWRWVATQIRTRPKYVAQRTGVEEIAYLVGLKAPESLPSLQQLEQLWREKFSKSAEQRRKVLWAWRDFLAHTQIGGLDQISSEQIIAYRDAIVARQLSGKSQSNLFGRIRRFISFAKERGIGITALTRTLELLSLLKPSETTVALNPNPISKSDFRNLLDSADGDDKAMLLLMLNCALYLKEVTALRWSDISGGNLISHRAKTGGCVRVAVFWKETQQAVARLPRRGDFLFYAYDGEPLGVKGAEKRFRKLRLRAGLPHVTSSMLRDGAYTAAVEANVNEQLCRMLAGHRTGISDHYVKRQPAMVGPACAAIRAFYFG